ncbi:MAG: hypothetical protein ACKO4S_05760, partial [Snowella sp.]
IRLFFSGHFGKAHLFFFAKSLTVKALEPCFRYFRHPDLASKSWITDRDKLAKTKIHNYFS